MLVVTITNQIAQTDMKRILAVIALVAGMALTASAQEKRLFDITENGLMYRFEKSNPAAQKVQRGDIVVGEMTLVFEGDTLMSNSGKPQRLTQVGNYTFGGDLTEGLLLMHRGDVAVFGVSADEMAKYVTPEQMPSSYVAGNGMRLFYTLKIDDILTPNDLALEQEQYLAEVRQRKAAEPHLIEMYLNNHSGPWVELKGGVMALVTEQGKGKAVKKGKTVTVDYVCRTIDGFLFDTSKKSVAEAEKSVVAGKGYSPLTYKVGDLALIEGWMVGLDGRKEGSKLTLLIPSSMAYGEQGAQPIVQAYTPLVLEIEVLSVK